MNSFPIPASGLLSIESTLESAESMVITEAIAIAAGGALGALSRWGLSIYFNPLFPTIPLGTLLANLVGGYLIGVAVAVFSSVAGLPPEARLFAVTGFLGGLTTFSTFSAEVVFLLNGGQFGWALLGASAHVVGSLVLTGLGILSGNYLLRVTAL